jgi:ribonuclease D
MELITDSGALAAFCARQQGADFIAVDTEFMRERTFWPILCATASISSRYWR